MIWSTDPFKKCFTKSPLSPQKQTNKQIKNHDKAVQFYTPWLNVNKINKYFYNQHINKGTPHFTFMRRAQNADIHMHSNSIGCPKILPPSAPVLYWLSHLTCILSPKAQVDFHTTKNVQIQVTPFSLFLDEF